jgi:hypothetical protein
MIHLMLWTELCPTKFMCWSPNSMWLHVEVIKLKLHHWGEMRYNWTDILITRGNFDTQEILGPCLHRRLCVKMQQEDSYLLAKERGLQQQHLLWPSEEINLSPWPWLGFPASRTVKNKFLFFQSVVFCYGNVTKLKHLISRLIKGDTAY